MLTKVLLSFVLVWIVLYILAYFILMNPNHDNLPSKLKASSSSSIKSSSLTNNQQQPTTTTATNVQTEIMKDHPQTNPFLSTQCKSMTTALELEYFNKVNKVGIIMVVHNEPLEEVKKSILSIFQNSNNLIGTLVIIDDFSDNRVSEASIWNELSSDIFTKISIMRTNSRIGLVAAKEDGVKYLVNLENKMEYYVFVDAHVIVSESWLLPLVNTIEKHPKSLVYPTIDILTNDGFVQADNMIGTFNWELKFIWESWDATRMPLLPSVPVAEEAISTPAAPGIVAISAAYYQEIGGFDPKLTLYGVDSVELSLRVWLCGGTVIKQPCSRVAHHYQNFDRTAIIGHGVTQRVVDDNVISVAERYLKKSPYKEVVYQARFLNRVPYPVEIDQGERFSESLYKVTALAEGTCQEFDWFLQEIFPGLAKDADSIRHRYSQHIHSNYLIDALRPFLDQYNHDIPVTYDAGEVDRLKRLAEENGEKDIQDHHDLFIPEHAAYIHPQDRLIDLAKIRREKAIEDAKKAQEAANADAAALAAPAVVLEANANNVQAQQFSVVAAAVKAQDVAPAAVVVAEDHNQLPVNPIDTNHNLPPPGAVLHAGIAAIGGGNPYVDPTAAQRAYHEGKLVEPGTDIKVEATCTLNRLPNGELLSRVTIHDPSTLPTNPKIFCGIYTMASKHESNVKITRNTWAKKCDGFVAFSTVTDPLIPSVNITHEGPEAYDNMWQKSRSIWKYIAQHYSDQYDYFLLGGDDMFYIVENLRYYLVTSPLINSIIQQKTGLFLGRRFFPPKQEVFNSGGAGYILDKVSLQVLKDNLDKPHCYPHQVGFWEDVNIANCLRKSANILPIDSRDDQERERFHPFTPGLHLTYRIPKVNPDWYPQYNPYLKEGFDCCSPDSISFHYAPADILSQLYIYLYHCQTKEQSSLYGVVNKQ